LKEVRYKQFLSHSGRVPAADYHESGNEIPPLYMATNFMTSWAKINIWRIVKIWSWGHVGVFLSLQVPNVEVVKWYRMKSLFVVYTKDVSDETSVSVSIKKNKRM